MALLPCASCQAAFPAVGWHGMVMHPVEAGYSLWELISGFQGWPIAELTGAFCH